MMKHLFLFIFLFSPLFGEEALTIRLGIESSLQPLYFGSLSEGSSFGSDYAKKLESILKFDLGVNGRTYLMKESSSLTSLLKKEKPFDKNTWEKERAFFVVKVVFKEKSISFQGFSLSKNRISGLDNIALTGNFSEDRKKMHAIADAIFESFFGEKGIASTRILYTQREARGTNSYEWKTDVFESDYDGGNPKALTLDGKLVVTPTFVPSKTGRARSFIYVSYLTGQPKLYMGTFGMRTSKRLSLLSGNQLMPSVSPKKDMLAFVSDIAGNPELFAQRFNEEEGLIGKPWMITSFPQGAQGSPSFSPDGGRLAFVSNKDGTPRIYVTPVPTPNTSVKNLTLTLISRLQRENTAPAWAPDGKKIAYSSMTQGTRQIWLYDFDSKKEIQITSGPGHKESPAWAPNSEHLVYHASLKEGSSELFLVHIGEKKPVLISSGSGEKRFASFESFCS